MTDVPTMPVYALLGQSNMQWRGELAAEPDETSPQGMRVLDEESRWACPVRCDAALSADAGIGPGYHFAVRMLEMHRGATLGLVPCAVGGSSIKRWGPGADLHVRAVERIRAASGRLHAVLWHQGESDATPAGRKLAETYAEHLVEVVISLRRAVGRPDLPAVFGELGRFIDEHGNFPNRRLVNRQLALAAGRLPRTALVGSEELVHRGDAVHFHTTAHRILGRRFADAVISLEGPES